MERSLGSTKLFAAVVDVILIEEATESALEEEV